MSWTLLAGAALVLGVSVVVAALRRVELDRMRRSVAQRDRAVREGRAEAELGHPVVDLTRCLGCGTCVLACPEEDVLDLVHGQAKVVHGSRCKGIAACARECPVDAIKVELTGLDTRRDVPVLTDELEAVGTPGIFLAGEVTAHALIQTAIEHGTRVATTVAQRRERRAPAPADDPERLDLVIVGAGPAGIACALEAKRHGLRFAVLEQESGPGGTVAKYPRRKLVLLRPVDLPLHGRLGKRSYTKEEIVELWQALVAEHDLPVLASERLEALERDGDVHVVRTRSRSLRSANVCLALGRRGTPRKLGVPGEELEHVTYSLLDARSYAGRRVLVVGGGDSALEAAVGLSEQQGTDVVLSYRGGVFSRARSRNEARILEAEVRGRLRIVRDSEVRAISRGAVELAVAREEGVEVLALPVDDVFVLAGGEPPFELLERSGVSLDPELRRSTAGVDAALRPAGAADASPDEQGPGFLRALGLAFGITLVALLFALWNADYYLLPSAEKPLHPKHAWLRPGRGLGLWLGGLATALVAVNMLYVARRSPRVKLEWGSMRLWMTSHVATGVMALLCALLHSAMAPRDTAGGHAFWALALLVVTGAIGRYFYAYVPRAANGRELMLDEVKARLRSEAPTVVSVDRRFVAEARDVVLKLIEARQWKGNLLGRVFALCGLRLDLHRAITKLTRRGRARGVSEAQIAETMQLARHAHRTALMAAHYEDLRALLATWRYVHRWAALLMLLLLVGHVLYALSYGSLMGGGTR